MTCLSAACSKCVAVWLQRACVMRTRCERRWLRVDRAASPHPTTEGGINGRLDERPDFQLAIANHCAVVEEEAAAAHLLHV